ncbi:MAG: serine/threonine-protein kinase, partial [Candidatus Krumholzibacteria bacterium]|nr:serine/threonine-protein kinase [Candidatus Krumholzibacteria bacterium]
MIGKTFAHYEITEQIGAGGMGEVYRARDTKLDRDVAVKVLPEIVAQDAERLTRFRREAKLLASFNHAHIATLHGLEESNGRQFLVMELVEGEDLSQRIKRGPIPVKETLKIAGEVAGALQEAHERGIIHRDLKPANIKVTSDGNVKVLDFGLAKALETDADDPGISQSPTLAASMGTMGGVILGTAAYMSPEQARGKTLDRRTDIWALGCVIYEMLTGQSAFPGETVSDTIAKILEREPDWNALPPDTPPSIQVLIRRCLQKEQKKRLQDVGDLRIQIEEARSGAADSWTGPVAVAPPPTGRGAHLAWMTATAVAAVAAIGFAVAFFATRTKETATVRSVITPAANTTVLSAGDNAGPAVISPDGRMLAYVAGGELGQRRVWIRHLDDLLPRAVTGTENATFPFWSPDSRSIAFFADSKLKRVDLAGGLPISLCDATNGRGGSWGADGTIVFSPDFRTPLQRVPASGGTPTDVTKIDTDKHTTHRWPYFMPDGKHFVYIAANHDISLSENNAIYFATLGNDDAKLIQRSSTRAVYASGYLLFLRDATLMAAPFAPGTGELGADPVPLPDKVAFDPTTWIAAISASDNGTLAYHAGGIASSKNRLAWFDRSGKELDVLDETEFYYSISISPGEDRVAVAGGINSMDIWTIDFTRRLRTRLTFDPTPDARPIWSPNQRYVAATRLRVNTVAEPSYIYRVNSTGGNEQKLLQVENDNVWVTDWSS